MVQATGALWKWLLKKYLHQVDRVRDISDILGCAVIAGLLQILPLHANASTIAANKITHHAS